MSGQPRPTRPRSISVLTPADLVGGLGREGDLPPTPHATPHPRSHADDSPLSLLFHPEILRPRLSLSLSLFHSPLPPPPEEATPPSGLAQRQGHPTGPARRVQGEGGGFIAATFYHLFLFSPSLSSLASGRETLARERKVEEEGVISVGRAGCIRSNIMQAHNRPGCVGSLRISLHLFYALLHAQRVHGRVYIYIFSFPSPLFLSLCVCHSCVHLYPTCIEIARALNPGSGHEIVIPERLTLLPHLAGAPRSQSPETDERSDGSGSGLPDPLTSSTHRLPRDAREKHPSQGQA